MRDIIFYFAIKYFGEWERIYDAIDEQEEVDFDQLAIWQEEYEGRYITCLDEEYPISLKHISRPPFVIFYKGDKKIFTKGHNLWYYGSYYTNDYTDLVQKHYKETKKEDITLISGYTNEFERRFVNNVNPKGMIIVRDSGIDSYINMTRIEEEHFIQDNLIISEYPDKVIPSLNTWLNSARIKSGLADGVVLLNTLKERITFKFISEALDEKRKVFCIENKIDTKSQNFMLISKGAYAINKLKETKW